MLLYITPQHVFDYIESMNKHLVFQLYSPPAMRGKGSRLFYVFEVAVVVTG